MTPEQHLALLGADSLAEIRRRVALAPAPTQDVIEKIRPILAPAVARVSAMAIDLDALDPDQLPSAA